MEKDTQLNVSLQIQLGLSMELKKMLTITIQNHYLNM